MKLPELAFEDFVLDRTNAQLLRAGKPVLLAPKPFDVLTFLVDRRGELVTKDDLFDNIWSNLNVSESSLSVAIAAVRSALGDKAEKPRFIETVTRRGFRFIAPVTILPERQNDLRSIFGVAPKKVRYDPSSSWWVGRETQLERVHRLSIEATAGNRQIIFITGEAGIGKTTFTEMLALQLSKIGFDVLWARCVVQFGSGEAFLPLIEALQEFCNKGDVGFRHDLLSGHAPTWLTQMPGLLDSRQRAALQKEVFGATRERMLREFCELIEHASMERPLLIVIEDLHWSDFATLDVFSLLAQRRQMAPLLVLASYRPGDVLAGGHPVRTVHQELQIRGRCEEIPLDRLSLNEVERYLQLRFRDFVCAHELASRIYRRTEGQPLFMATLTDYLASQQDVREVDGRWKVAADEAISRRAIPENLRLMIGRQIDQLSDSDQHLVESASISGMDFSAAVVASLLDVPIPAVERACEQLVRRRQILIAAGSAEWPDGTVSGKCAFQHSLYQETLLQRLAPGQAIDIHRRTGERLEAAYGKNTQEIAAVLALHFENGRDTKKAVHYLEQAAESARRRFGNREAETYLTHALGLVERLPAETQLVARMRLLRQRGRVRQSSSDDIRHALSDFLAVVTCAVETKETRAELRALLDLSRYSLLWIANYAWTRLRSHSNVARR